RRGLRLPGETVACASGDDRRDGRPPRRRALERGRLADLPLEPRSHLFLEGWLLLAVGERTTAARIEDVSSRHAGLALGTSILENRPLLSAPVSLQSQGQHNRDRRGAPRNARYFALGAPLMNLQTHCCLAPNPATQDHDQTSEPSPAGLGNVET